MDDLVCVYLHFELVKWFDLGFCCFLCLYSVFLHVCAYHTSAKRPFPSNLVYTIWRQMQRGIWPVHVVQVAFKVLKSIATIDQFSLHLLQLFPSCLPFCFFNFFLL